MHGSITTHRTMPRWRHHHYFPFHQKELRSNLERKGKYLRQFVCQFELVQKNRFMINALSFYLVVQIILVMSKSGNVKVLFSSMLKRQYSIWEAIDSSKIYVHTY